MMLKTSLLLAVALMSGLPARGDGEEDDPLTELIFEHVPDIDMPNQGGIPFPVSVDSIEDYLSQVKDAMWRRRLPVEEEQATTSTSTTTSSSASNRNGGGLVRRQTKKSSSIGGSCRNNGQTVYLEFLNPVSFLTDVRGSIHAFDSYVFSQEDQWEILANLQNDFSGFDVDFQLDPPSNGCEYSTVTIGPPEGEVWISLVRNNIQNRFGVAGRSDFLNRFKSGHSIVNPCIWMWFYQFGILVRNEDYGRRLFFSFSGMDQNMPIQDAMREATIRTASDTAAHELGHMMGLRHYDSFGSQNQNGGFVTYQIQDGYIMHSTADQSNYETWSHIMASGRYSGLPYQQRATFDRFFSERSAIKLLLAEQRNNGVFFDEYEAKQRGGTIGANQPGLQLNQMVVPNTIVAGQFEGNRLATSAVVVQDAYMEGSDDSDQYRFRFDQGQFINIEAQGWARAEAFQDLVLLGITIHQEDEFDGSLHPLYTSYQEFETLDPIILDFEIWESGNYVVEVFARQTVCDVYGRCADIDLEDFDLQQGYYDLLLYSIDRPLGRA